MFQNRSFSEEIFVCLNYVYIHLLNINNSTTGNKSSVGVFKYTCVQMECKKEEIIESRINRLSITFWKIHGKYTYP